VRILVVTPWWPSSRDDPFGSFVRDQARALTRSGHDVRVEVLRLWRPWIPFAPTRSVPPEPEGPRVRVRVAPWLPHGAAYESVLRRDGFAMRRALARNARWAGQCVVLAHTQDLAVPAAGALQGSGVPWALVAHGAEPASPRLDRPGRRDRWRRAAASAARILAVGPGLADALRAEVPGADVRSVPNGFDRLLVERVARGDRSAGEPRVVSVGNLVPGKGIHLVLDALRRVPAEVAWTYDVVGDGPERERLEAIVAERGWSSRVRFHGALAHEAALSVVLGARVFALPSAPEAFGIAYLEAMALGVPVIGVRGEGPQAFVHDGEDGWLVAPTEEGVAEPLVRAFLDPERARAAGAAARISARGRDWDTAAAELVRNLPEPVPATRARKLWMSIYEEPTPYVTAKLDLVEARGAIRWRRHWASPARSQAWGADAPHDASSVLSSRSGVLAAVGSVLGRRVAGIHAGGWGGSPVVPLLLAAGALARLPLSIETDTHATTSRGARAGARRLWLRLLDRRVRAWWPAGTPQAEHLRAWGCRRGRVVVERMTTDTAAMRRRAHEAGPEAGARWRSEHGIPPEASLVLFVGRVVEEKGVADLLHSVARLRSEGRDVRAAVLGPGDVRPHVPSGLGPEALVAAGRVAWADLVPAYVAADVLALPSRREPWGLVVNEALCLGCPVVVTDAVGAARDLVAAPRSGRVVATGDVGALATGIREVLDAGGRASPEAERGRACMEGWTIEGAAARLSAVLETPTDDGSAATC
jgi:teichuronic acid biosynthesis glycosyltransferase TuaC